MERQQAPLAQAILIHGKVGTFFNDLIAGQDQPTLRRARTACPLDRVGDSYQYATTSRCKSELNL